MGLLTPIKLNKFFKLGLLNVSIVTLVALIVWSFISYIEGHGINMINIIGIILLMPIVLYLIKDVTAMYRNLNS